MALKTYLGEFCAHKDEKTQSQELVRGLHLCPPVAWMRVSHPADPRTPRLPLTADLDLIVSGLDRGLLCRITPPLKNPTVQIAISLEKNGLCAYF